MDYAINKFKEAYQNHSYCFWSVPKVIKVSDLKNSKGLKQLELLTNWVSQVNSLDDRFFRMNRSKSFIARTISSLQKSAFNISSVLPANLNKDIKDIILSSIDKLNSYLK